MTNQAQKIDRPTITGQVMIRHTTMKAPDGRPIYCIFGVVAGPEGLFEKDSVLHKVAGELSNHPCANSAQLNVLLDATEGIGPEYQGFRVDQLLTAPIWRV